MTGAPRSRPDRPDVLVTGAAGFLGSHLTEALLARGHRVTGIDCFPPYYDAALKRSNLSQALTHQAFRFVEMDLSTGDGAPYLPAGGWVFHQAAQPGVRASWDAGFADYLGHNLLATQRLLEACRRVDLQSFVFASSSSVYGNIPEGEVSEDDPRRPMSPYGVTKVGGEELMRVYHREFGVPTVSLRYFTVCGPRQRPDMAFHKILRALATDTPFPLYGDGNQERDFTDVSDAVEANLLAAERGERGAVYNVGGGHPVNVAHAISVLESASGRKARLDRKPRAEGDPRRTAANLSRARRDLGYDPKVPVDEALRREAAWFLDPQGPLALAGKEPA